MRKKKQQNLVHIEFKEPINGITHDYFGCIKAIYDTYTREQVGVAYRTLIERYNIVITPFEGEKCKIYYGSIKTKRQTKKNVSGKDF